MRKRGILLLCSSLVALTMITVNCKKEKDNGSDDDDSKTELLTKSVWKLSKAEANGIDYTDQFEDCTKDNTIVFVSTSNEHGTGIIDEGPTKCDPSDPQTTPFTWELSNSGTILKSSTPLFDGGSTDFTVDELSSTKFVVSQTMTIPGFPLPVSAKFTLVH